MKKNQDNYLIKNEEDLLNSILYGDVSKVENYEREYLEDYQYFYKVYWPCGEIHIYERYADELKLVGYGSQHWFTEFLELRKRKVQEWLS